MNFEDTPQRRKAGEAALEVEWSIAESKSSWGKKRRKTRRESESQPSISFLRGKPVRISVRDLQDLALYVLADGVAPTWLAVNNVQRITKVVVMMIPGLDREMLEDSEMWNSVCANDDSVNIRQNGTTSPQADSDAQHASSASIDVSSTTNPQTGETASPQKDPPSKQHLKNCLLEHILEVRAPGESNRVHSPLQGMLISPIPTTKASKGAAKDEKSFQPVRTHIAQFVHSADELREAEYPIHPAAFTNPMDAELERERRESTAQSTSSGWVDTSVSISVPTPPIAPPSVEKPQVQDPITQGLRVYALDCEMVLTNDEKHSLARVSILDWSGRTVVDKYVLPARPITNYFTEYSGITAKHLEGVTTTLQDIQAELLELLGQDTILLGHSLESDMNALQITHPFVIDTSIIYPHPRGLPLRSSLKYLANKYLKREIQKGGANGHDSVEDARAVLDLVRLKCEKGPRWGTLDANGESIFRRIGREVKTDADGDGLEMSDSATKRTRTTAIVEYGTPERGFGKDASVKIACASDEEIVQGVLRAVRGDAIDQASREDGHRVGVNALREAQAPAQDQQTAQLGVDFVWSRLRDVEALRGWNNPPPANNTDTGPKSDIPSTALSAPPSSDLAPVARRTLSHVLNLYASLPPSTLLIIYSGTNDMRPVLRLQQLHNQYKREFKVKKWDELSVKWTDKEEQELRRAVEAARRGVGLLAIR